MALVVLVHREEPEHLDAYLESIEEQFGPGWEGEIVLFENAAQPATVAAARRGISGRFPNARATVMTSDRNLGFGAAANLAIARCSSEYVALFNPDGLLASGALERLVAALDDHGDAAAAGAEIVDRYRRTPSERPQVEVVDQLPGGAGVNRVKDFLGAGGFDPAYFLYHEDRELSRRFQARGRSLLRAHGAVYEHRIGWEQDNKERQRRFRHLIRSEAIFEIQFARTPLVILAFIGRRIWEMLGSLRQRDHAQFTGIALGVWDAPKEASRAWGRRKHPWDSVRFRSWIEAQEKHLVICEIPDQTRSSTG